MYEVSCVAGNKVDAAYAVKSLGPMGGHSSSQKDHHHYKNHQKYYNNQQQQPQHYSTKQQTKDRHHQNSKRHNEPLYETEDKTAHKSEKDNGVKSHVLRLLRRSKSHSNAQQHLEKEQLLQQQQLLAQQRHEDDTRQRDDAGNTKNRRRELDRRVMVTIVDGLPVVVTSRQHRAKVILITHFL